jgi:hypothetical protein
MSEVAIFFLLIEGSFAIQSKGLSSIQEIKGSGEIKDLELLSYNLMLDLCSNMKRWVTNIKDASSIQSIYSEFSKWEVDVTKYAQSERGVALSMKLEALNIEPYSGQSLDSYQAAFIGKNGNEKWHVSGILKIELKESWITRNELYRISITA